MAEQIKDGFNGANNWLKVNDDGSINVITSGTSTGGYTGSQTWVQNFPANQQVTISGEPMVGIDGHASPLNSTYTPLIANGSFVGTWEDVEDYAMIYTAVRTDAPSRDSGNYGFNLEFSMDGSVVDVNEEYFIGSSTIGKIYSSQPSCRYFRVNYINGSVAQGLFRLQTQYKHTYGKPSSHRIDDPINSQNDAELIKAVLTGQKPNGDYTNVDTTTAGNLKVSIEEFNGTSTLPSGTNFIGYVGTIQSGNTIGSTYTFTTIPTLVSQNPYTTLVYISSGTNTGISTGSSIGSIIKFIGAGSYVKVLTYSNNNLVNIGSWY